VNRRRLWPVAGADAALTVHSSDMPASDPPVIRTHPYPSLITGAVTGRYGLVLFHSVRCWPKSGSLVAAGEGCAGGAVSVRGPRRRGFPVTTASVPRALADNRPETGQTPRGARLSAARRCRITHGPRSRGRQARPSRGRIRATSRPARRPRRAGCAASAWSHLAGTGAPTNRRAARTASWIEHGKTSRQPLIVTLGQQHGAAELKDI